MKSFKQFIKESTEMGHMVNGVPCAIIEKPHKGNTSVSESFPHWVGKGHTGDVEDWKDSNDNESEGGHEGVHEMLSAHDHHDEDDAETIHHYTAESRGFNHRLYRNHVNGTPEKHPFRIDATVSKNKLPRPIHTYSGVNWHPGEMAAKHPEGHVHLPAFTSTSLDPRVAHSFAQDHGTEMARNKGVPHTDNHVIHFHLKAGQPSKYVGHTSEYPDERELILPRDTTIKVHPKPDTYEDEYSGEKTHIWHAHVV